MTNNIERQKDIAKFRVMLAEFQLKIDADIQNMQIFLNELALQITKEEKAIPLSLENKEIKS